MINELYLYRRETTTDEQLVNNTVYHILVHNV